MKKLVSLLVVNAGASFVNFGMATTTSFSLKRALLKCSQFPVNQKVENKPTGSKWKTFSTALDLQLVT
jgi:hypothetical protein